VSEGVVRAWRLTKARDAGDLTGQGAARDGQRWNQPGQRAVYLGMTPEITVLEVVVHLNGVLSAPLVLSGYDVPAGPGLIAKPDPNTLPEGWNAIPHGQACAAFGGDWLRTGQELGLVLPSVVVPRPAMSCSIPGREVPLMQTPLSSALPGQQHDHRRNSLAQDSIDGGSHPADPCSSLRSPGTYTIWRDAPRPAAPSARWSTARASRWAARRRWPGGRADQGRRHQGHVM